MGPNGKQRKSGSESSVGLMRRKRLLVGCACMWLSIGTKITPVGALRASIGVWTGVGRGIPYTKGQNYAQTKPCPLLTKSWHGSSLSSRIQTISASRPPRIVRCKSLMSLAEEENGGVTSEEWTQQNTKWVTAAVVTTATLLYGLQHVGGGGLDSKSLSTGIEMVGSFLGHEWDVVGGGFQAFLGAGVEKIQELGPLGPIYFGVLYVLAEVLAIPALPLTASSGFLFGIKGGTAVVLVSATVAAGISFLLGRTLLRERVEGLLADNARFRAIDQTIGKEGFKIIFLLRLSPIFPFALSNYLYGLTSVNFWEYISGTMLGFFPGTLAYVYTGTLGKSFTEGGVTLPWYVYAVGFALAAFALKTVGDLATKAVEEIEQEDEEPAVDGNRK